MADCPELTDLVKILRSNGDKILDATSKLTLSTDLMCRINSSFQQFCCVKQNSNCTFQVLDSSAAYMKGLLDLQFLYDFLQKTVALKILPQPFNNCESQIINLDIFKNLKLLELNRISLKLIKGLKYLRSHLEYLKCVHSLSNLNDILENCGADKTQGFLWNNLKKAVFTHNYLTTVDGSLEFIPRVEILDLSHNNLYETNAINCLSNLTHLNLGFNKLQFIPLSCKNLRVLKLHNNFIENINELSLLVNLEELDLSNNCLLQHKTLSPLNNLTKLFYLNLTGNPLSFHTNHRVYTIKFLNPSINIEKFILDGCKLTKKEISKVKLVLIDNFECGTNLLLERSYSLNSEETLNTVISNLKYGSQSSISSVIVSSKNKNVSILCSKESSRSISVESSNSDSTSSVYEEHSVNEEVQNQTITEGDDDLQMQDSGFFAGPKPLSRQSSIGSASSLFDNNVVIHNESDIEVLTNPSQSSIEVLDYKILS